VNGLASFMSERAIGTAFIRSSCVGGVGTSAASTEWFAGKEASNAPGITSVRISRGSIRPDERTVTEFLYVRARVPCPQTEKSGEIARRRPFAARPVRPRLRRRAVDGSGTALTDIPSIDK